MHYPGVSKTWMLVIRAACRICTSKHTCTSWLIGLAGLSSDNQHQKTVSIQYMFDGKLYSRLKLHTAVLDVDVVKEMSYGG